MTSPPLLVWMIAEPNDRQGAARLHGVGVEPVRGHERALCRSRGRRRRAGKREQQHDSCNA